MRQKLEQLTNIVIVAFVLVVGGLYLKDRFHPPVQTSRLQIPEIKTGDILPGLPGYDWHSSGRTLVLALRNGCHFCEESAPFYKKLEAFQKAGNLKDVHIVAIFPDDQRMAQRVMQKEGLGLDVIPAVNFQALKIEGTPMAILADQDGRVVKSWLGKLQEPQQNGLLEAIGMTKTRAELR
jgi:hypothetical protein